MAIASTSFFRPATLVLVGTLAFSAVAARADDAIAPAAEPARTELCLQLNRIRQTRVVDDKTVLFYLSSKEIYKNVLPYKCGALQIDQTFLYKSSINQICSVDTITPLLRTGGGYMPSASCGLGKFEPIDKATAEKLLTEAKTARRASN